MSKYNLLITASTFPGNINDTEPRFVYDLAMNLKDDFNITILIPASFGLPLHEKMNGLNIIRYRYAPLRSMETLTYPGAVIARIREKPIRVLLVPFMMLGMYRETRKLLKSENFHCVHAHWFIPQGAIQLLFKNKKYPPFIVTGHGGDIFGLDNTLCNYIKSLVAKHATVVTVVSNALKEKLINISDINKNKIKILPMGCDLKLFSPDLRIKNYYKSKYNIEGTIILFVGRLVEKKGVIYLLKAMNSHKLRNTDAKLVIIGDGSLKQNLIKLSNSLGLQNSVYFINSLPHKELSSAYASADIFCGPSIVANDGDTEGLGLVFLEASASGLPIIATNIAGVRDAVKDKYSGFLVKQKRSDLLSDALLKLIKNPELRKEIGKNGTEYVKKYSWDNVAYKYKKLINKVIEKHKI